MTPKLLSPEQMGEIEQQALPVLHDNIGRFESLMFDAEQLLKIHEIKHFAGMHLGIKAVSEQGVESLNGLVPKVAALLAHAAAQAERIAGLEKDVARVLKGNAALSDRLAAERLLPPPHEEWWPISTNDLLKITQPLDEHPEDWDFPCLCAECRSSA